MQIELLTDTNSIVISASDSFCWPRTVDVNQCSPGFHMQNENKNKKSNATTVRIDKTRCKNVTNIA